MSRKRIPLNQNECTADFRIGVPFEQNLHFIFNYNYSCEYTPNKWTHHKQNHTEKQYSINQMLGDKSSYQAQLQLNIASAIRASQATSVENIDEKLMALQQELIQKAQSKEAYDEIADEIFRLRELRQQTTVDTAARDEQIKRINDLQDYLAQQTTHLTEFDESLVRRWIKQITIWDDHITIELKSGVSIDVDA